MALPSSAAGGSMGRLSEATSSVRSVIGLQTQAEKNESCFPEMSYRTRLIGVTITFCSGVVVSILSTLFLSSLRMTPFAVFYTLGNILAMSSSLFMMGIRRQCRLMWKKERAAATVIYLFAMICTLIAAFAAPRPFLPCIVLIAIQFAAGLWYTLSYIPYARQMCISCCKETTGLEGV